MEAEVSHQRPLPPTSGAAALAPGFRFHPTDEELVSFYLKRKICQKPFQFDPIAEIDIYKSEPWDLPIQSRLKSRDLEWYFFSGLDKKYGNGSKTNRATEQGYWKTTGKDRAIRRRNRTVGMKKTLVYHIGRAPRGQRTNWVMHEYRLVDEELEQAGVAQDAFVLCRVFQKSGSGPKNGEQYGAPFIEEEWDEEVLIPKKEDASDAFFDIGDVGCVQQNGLDRDIDTATSSENVPLPSSFYYVDTGNPVEDVRGYEDDRTVFIGHSEKDGEPLFDIQEFFNLPGSCEIEQAEVKNDYFVELNDLVNTTDADCHTEAPTDELDFLDTVPDSHFGDGKFLEIDDIENHAKTDPLGLDMLEEYLLYFDAVDDHPQHVALGSSSILISEDSGQIESTPVHEQVNEGMNQESLQPLETNGAEGASSSKQIQKFNKFEQEFDYDDKFDSTLSKRATHMLGLIPAPPAHALGFPAKGQAATNSSGSIHVTAGMIRLTGVTVTCNGKDWSLDKNGDVDFLLSYSWPTTVVFAGDLLLSNGTDLEPTASNALGKAWSVMLRSGFYLVFYCILVLSMTWKIGTCMKTR